MQARALKDRLAGSLMETVTLATIALVALIVAALAWRAWPILQAHPLNELLFSNQWRPQRGAFGFWPFIAGTLWVTGLAMLLAVPPCLLSAIYLSEYARPRTRRVVKPLVDLLAGIPSVVYGVWGLLFVVPLVKDHLIPFARDYLQNIPWLAATNTSGYGVLAGGIVLAVMVFPILISVTEDVLSAVPRDLREASLAMGATPWQTIKSAVLRKAAPGIIAAIVLGFSRAFGETMAVLMVVGNVARVPGSVFDPAYPLPALIANNYGEMMSIPLYDAALLLGALVLLALVLGFTVLARAALVRAVRRAA
jgi:phosphate transport system permease protein